MGFLDKLLNKKKVETLPALQESILPVLQKKEEPASIAVVLKGVKYFDIYQDGNGYYRAQYKDGNWLRSREHLTDFYEHASKGSTLSEIEEKCTHYIKSQELIKVGTIEFIPSK